MAIDSAIGGQTIGVLNQYCAATFMLRWTSCLRREFRVRWALASLASSRGFPALKLEVGLRTNHLPPLLQSIRGGCSKVQPEDRGRGTNSNTPRLQSSRGGQGRDSRGRAGGDSINDTALILVAGTEAHARGPSRRLLLPRAVRSRVLSLGLIRPGTSPS